MAIVDLLATTIPAQSTFFLQIAFVGTVVMCGLEMLRAVPLALAGVRRCIGPNLTEAERQTTFMGICPLADPIDFPHADVMSGYVVLYMLISLVYQTIAPITSFVLGFCFLYLETNYRHQFVYIYPTIPDSGGKIWSNFIQIVCLCMILAEVVCKFCALLPCQFPSLLRHDVRTHTALF